MKLRVRRVAMVLAVVVALACVVGVAAQTQRRPAVGLLCVWECPSSDLVEDALIEKMRVLRTEARLGKKALPIMVYGFDKPSQRIYCQKTLGIATQDIPCIAVAHFSLDDGVAVPDRLLERIDGAGEYLAGPTRLVARAIEEQLHDRNIGLLVVLARGHAPVPGAIARLQEMAGQQSLLHGIVEQSTALMKQRGFHAGWLKVIEQPSLACSSTLERLGVAPGRLPLAAIVDVEPNGAFGRVLFEVKAVGSNPPAGSAQQLYSFWSGRLAGDVLAPHPYRVTIRGASGKFVRVADNGPAGIVCDRTTAGDDARFRLVDYNGDVPTSGHQVAISTQQDLFFCAEENGGRNLVANRKAKGPWETFWVRKVGSDPDPEIHSGDKVLFATDKGRCWTVQNNPSGIIDCRADAASPGVWETFRIIFMDEPAVGPSRPQP